MDVEIVHEIFGVLFLIITLSKVDIQYKIILEVAQDVPKQAEKVAAVEDQYDQSECAYNVVEY